MSVKTVPFSDELIQNIAAKYGTPFHIYDEKGMLDNVKRFQKAFSWNPNFHEYFAVKATPNPWIMKSLKTLDVGSDCSSMAELVLAESVGIKGEEIVFSTMIRLMKNSLRHMSWVPSLIWMMFQIWMIWKDFRLCRKGFASATIRVRN